MGARSSIRSSDMKNFLIKLALFASVIGILLALMGWIMFDVEKRCYYDTLELGPGDAYVAIGDSRSEQSLDPQVVKGLKNISLAGSQIAVWEARLRDLMMLNSDDIKRTVIIEASPLQFEVSREHCARKYEYDRAILWLLHPELRQSVQFENLYLWYVKREFPVRALQLITAKARRMVFRSMLWGRFSRPAEQSGYTNDEITKRSSACWLRLRDFMLTEADRQSLDPIVELCKKKGWNLIIVTFPICDFDPASDMMRRFRNDIAGYCRTNGARYLDLTNLCCERKYWLDSVHVNCLGSKIISERFNELIN